jgi:hypothetical protein
MRPFSFVGAGAVYARGHSCQKCSLSAGNGLTCRTSVSRLEPRVLQGQWCSVRGLSAPVPSLVGLFAISQDSAGFLVKLRLHVSHRDAWRERP